MSAAPDPDPPLALHRFELEVCAEREGRPWHAILQVRATEARIEFDSPLALLRYLAQLTLADRKGGLR